MTESLLFTGYNLTAWQRYSTVSNLTDQDIASSVVFSLCSIFFFVSFPLASPCWSQQCTVFWFLILFYFSLNFHVSKNSSCRFGNLVDWTVNVVWLATCLIHSLKSYKLFISEFAPMSHLDLFLYILIQLLTALETLFQPFTCSAPVLRCSHLLVWSRHDFT